MIDQSELDDLRTDALTSLPDTCSVLRSTATSDGLGGTSDSWVAVASGVACRMAPVAYTSAAVEDQVGARIAAENVWTLTLAWDQDVRQDDRVLFDGRTFEIVYIGADRTWQIVKRLGLVELA